MAAKIRKGDKVIVLTGRDKGRSGEVIEVRPTEGRALVRGVNMVKRHQKQTAQQEGGIISKEARSICRTLRWLIRKDGKPTRVGFKVMNDGRKVRIARRSGDADRWLIRTEVIRSASEDAVRRGHSRQADPGFRLHESDAGAGPHQGRAQHGHWRGC